MVAWNPTVQCDECGDQYTCRYTTTPQRLVEWLRAENWLVDGDRHTCPNCAKGIDMDERGPRERLKDQLARVHGYQNYEMVHDAARQSIDADAEEILFRRQQRNSPVAHPPLTTPRPGDSINAECSYVKRASSIKQAAYWNAALADDPVFGPACGLSVGVAPDKDSDGRYPLIWVATAMAP